MIISKQRNGPVGTVKLQFAKECGRFHSLSRRVDAPPPEAGFATEPEPDAGESWGGELEPPF